MKFTLTVEVNAHVENTPLIVALDTLRAVERDLKNRKIRTRRTELVPFINTLRVVYHISGDYVVVNRAFDELAKTFKKDPVKLTLDRLDGRVSESGR